MVINGLAEALLTTPEWLTGLSDDKEYDTYTLCQRDIEEHIKKYLDTVSHTVKGEPRQQLLTTFLGKMVDLYTVMTYYFADAMEEVDRVAEDKGLKESLGRYAIELSLIHILGKKLNINKVHPHQFRRTLATKAIDKGMPIEQVQNCLLYTSRCV